jgi:hypothetical protein
MHQHITLAPSACTTAPNLRHTLSQSSSRSPFCSQLRKAATKHSEETGPKSWRSHQTANACGRSARWCSAQPAAPSNGRRTQARQGEWGNTQKPRRHRVMFKHLTNVLSASDKKRPVGNTMASILDQDQAHQTAYACGRSVRCWSAQPAAPADGHRPQARQGECGNTNKRHTGNG